MLQLGFLTYLVVQFPRFLVDIRTIVVEVQHDGGVTYLSGAYPHVDESFS